MGELPVPALLDRSDISAAKRLARCAGLWRTDVEHMEKTAKAFGPAQEAEVAQAKEHVLTALRVR